MPFVALLLSLSGCAPTLPDSLVAYRAAAIERQHTVADGATSVKAVLTFQQPLSLDEGAAFLAAERLVPAATYIYAVNPEGDVGTLIASGPDALQGGTAALILAENHTQVLGVGTIELSLPAWAIVRLQADPRVFLVDVNRSLGVEQHADLAWELYSCTGVFPGVD